MRAHLHTTINAVLFRLQRRRRDRTLRSLIRGRRVLVLGSGPSVKTLSEIPDDTLVFSCNFGPQILLDRGLRPHIDLYILTRQALTDASYRSRIEKLLAHISIGALISRDPRQLKKKVIVPTYSHLFYSDARDGRFLEALIPNHEERERLALGKRSNGIRLLEYALYYGAREVYLAGMDLHGNGYGFSNPDDNSIYEKAHQNADHEFMTSVARNHPNVFAASPESPVTSFVPHHPLA